MVSWILSEQFLVPTTIKNVKETIYGLKHWRFVMKRILFCMKKNNRERAFEPRGGLIKQDGEAL